MVGDLKLNLAIVQLALAQFLAEGLARAVAGVFADQRVQHPFLGSQFGLGDDALAIKGALASFARRRAISVLPTPVGPIIRMFFGNTSSRMSSVSCWRRQRLRSAMATARLASF
jgi:hypothetical protein